MPHFYRYNSRISSRASTSSLNAKLSSITIALDNDCLWYLIYLLLVSSSFATFFQYPCQEIMSYTITRLDNLRGVIVSDALSFIEETEAVEDIKMYMDLGIPDEMLGYFLKLYPLAPYRETPLPGKTYLKYERRNQTWRAALSDYFHFEGRQLNLKLSHDGFRYHHRPYKLAGLTIHKRKDWFLLGDDVLNDMPKLNELIGSLNAEIHFYYNIKHKRIDIDFFRGDLREPFLKITFEGGHPETNVDSALRFGARKKA